MDRPNNYFAIIPAIVRYDKDLSANAKLIYSEISALKNENTGYCWATNAYFTKVLGLSERTIQRELSALVDKGYVRRDVIREDGSNQVKERRLYALYDYLSAPSYVTPPPDKNDGTPPDKFDTTPPDKFDGYTNIVKTSNIITNNKERDISKDISPKKEEAVPFQKIVSLFHEHCPFLPKVVKVTEERKKHIRARWQDAGKELSTFEEVFETVARSRFLNPKTNEKKKWLNFDWIMKEANFVKIQEGKYSNEEWGSSSSSPSSPRKAHVVSEKEYMDELATNFGRG